MLRSVIVEDEPVSLNRLRRLLSKHVEEVTVVGEAQDGSSAVELIDHLKPDVVFLDVSLPGLNGFQVLEAVSFPVAVVFTTAGDEHAVRAFRASAMDYLLKPVDPDHLATALSRVAGAKRSSSRPPNPQVAQEPAALLKKPLKRLSCRVGNTTVFVNLRDVQYFRSDHGYTTVRCLQNEYLIDTPLVELELRLDPEEFVRVHRSTLINLNHVKQLHPLINGRMQITLNDGTEVESSRRYTDNLKNFTL